MTFSGNIIQSAFKFSNGKRIIVYTGSSGVKSFLCDDNFLTLEKPFAECDHWYGSDSDIEYHKKIRQQHSPEDFVKEFSTDLNKPPYANPSTK